MARGSKTSGNGAFATSEVNPEITERKRLKNLALMKGILSESAAKASSSLSASKMVFKHHGKDILKKSQRKNRYLFSFPGLLGQISGGKIGELKDLNTKNPILYLDFPQGQLKLFGTIVFPRNRYLTLQFPKGGKNVTCEDYFDNMIVFSEVWWIGKKEENPKESRLEFPDDMNQGRREYDFKGGVGAPSGIKVDSKKTIAEESPNFDVEVDLSNNEKNLKDIATTPARRSVRTAGKPINFAGGSSGDDSSEDDDRTSEGEEKVENLSSIQSVKVSKRKTAASKALNASNASVTVEDEVDIESNPSTMEDDEDDDVESDDDDEDWDG